MPIGNQTIKFLDLYEKNKDKEVLEELGETVQNAKFAKYFIDPDVLSMMPGPEDFKGKIAEQLLQFKNQSEGDSFTRLNEPILFTHCDLGIKTLLFNHVKYTIDRNPSLETICEASPKIAEELNETYK